MKTPHRLRNTILVVTLALTCGIICGLQGCDTPPPELPACQPPPGSAVDTETCVDFDNLALCRWTPPDTTYVFGCVTTTRSASNDPPGIECVKACPPNQYDSDAGTDH